ncbi:hypothetical protein BJ741DRAFT_324073 [Chytriomyces cf. hyalinus JEL632]|nr:hypothetical protein BJ741DRAFT_324073 [Chytriomyces cf. hyalinus JEL632]
MMRHAFISEKRSNGLIQQVKLDSKKKLIKHKMPSLPTVEFDVIVVGAGIVGCAAATAFANDGRKVLLIGSLMLSKLRQCVSILTMPLREYLAVYQLLRA